MIPNWLSWRGPFSLEGNRRLAPLKHTWRQSEEMSFRRQMAALEVKLTN